MPRSPAEYYRAHREAMELALQLGCTPKEAAELLRKRAAQAAEAAARARMAAPLRQAPGERPAREPRAAADRDQPWMMRD
jgi:hypothetical protein